MKASVIIPVFNAEEHLRQCLDSLLSQSADDFEIICVDDGSSDGSLSMLREYEDNHDGIFRVAVQSNEGPGSARMTGIGLAQGDYLFFLDADDFAEPDMVQHALSAAERTCADVVIWDVKYYNERFSRSQNLPEGTLRPEEFAPAGEVFSWKDAPDAIFSAFQNWPWNKAFRRDFVLDNGIEFGPFHRTEDLQFVAMALVLAERISFLPERLVNYRIGQPSSAMASKDLYPFDLIDAFVLLRSTLMDKGVFDDLEKGFISWTLSGLVYTLNTLNTKEAYDAFCTRLLHEGGVHELGIDERALSLVEEMPQAREFGILMEEGSDGYTFYRSRTMNAFLDDLFAKEDFAQTEIRNLHGSVDARGKEIDRLYVEWDKSNKRLDACERKYRALECEHEELQRRFDEMAHAAEQRIGKAICALPRYIQRKALSARKGV